MEENWNLKVPGVNPKKINEMTLSEFRKYLPKAEFCHHGVYGYKLEINPIFTDLITGGALGHLYILYKLNHVRVAKGRSPKLRKQQDRKEPLVYDTYLYNFRVKASTLVVDCFGGNTYWHEYYCDTIYICITEEDSIFETAGNTKDTTHYIKRTLYWDNKVSRGHHKAIYEFFTVRKQIELTIVVYRLQDPGLIITPDPKLYS